MFCSRSCLDYSKDKYMCAADEEFSIIPRIMLQALEMWDGDLEILKTFIENPQLRNKTVFDFDLSDDRGRVMSQLISINSLQTNNASMDLNEYIGRHPILQRWKTDEEREKVKSILRHITDITFNSLGFDWWELSFDGDHLVRKSSKRRDHMLVGYGIYPVSSLFNHQCHFNADRISIDNKLVIFVRFPIREGQQVFINYGYYQFISDNFKSS